MRAYDIIKKKRDGAELTDEEIGFFIRGYTAGDIPDYQAAAFCMAVYFKGMTNAETAALTFAIRDSGERLDFSEIGGIRVDKHSTGGVGDKTSLVVMPIVASLGLTVAKMSGRGLGHTGGTVDKLESIQGFRVDLSSEEFVQTVKKTGIAIVGQSKTLAPADKLLYALRDVTATVDSLPLIASSIMGKKLAADDDCIVLDVKTGSGAFMKTQQESKALAEVMVDIGKRAGKKICALVTDMDIPLGRNIGNSLEVIEAVETLKGRGEEDLKELCVELATNIARLAGLGNTEHCKRLVLNAIESGAALEKLKETVAAQGGDPTWIEDTELFPKAAYSYSVKAEKSGYIGAVDTEGYGAASLLLGAGRNKIGDPIDYAAGIVLKKKTGERVEKGEEIAVLYAETPEKFQKAVEKILSSTAIVKNKPQKRALILERIE